jgi:formylglycine-generating enzyme required for sulfatase activity
MAVALISNPNIFVGFVAASVGVAGALFHLRSHNEVHQPEMIDLQPRAFEYRMAGEFNQDSQPVDGPRLALSRSSSLHIMKHQVTAQDYDRCVADGRCMVQPPYESSATDVPAVQISWQDATAYAIWLSEKTGETWRLPTDEEWVFAAGSRFRDDALLIAASRDPSARWLARYEKESQQDTFDQRARPIGAFGANEFGLLDLAGNVWEWTNTCYIRRSVDKEGKPVGLSTVNCGVRVVEGEHRTYVTDFVRDARIGGCSVGKPPDNLGFRLIREDNWFEPISSMLRNLIGVAHRTWPLRLNQRDSPIEQSRPMAYRRLTSFPIATSFPLT